MEGAVEPKDVLIIGSGAGGGPLALTLSRAGLKVLVLEKGPRHTRRDYDHQHGLQPGAFVPSVDEEPHTVVTRKTTTPLLTNLGWIATCVGGGTVHMGSYLYRFHPDDFRMRSRFGPHPEVDLADWPYGYDELEPWYSRAEWEVGVAGQAGANPFEGHRSRPYPLPPLAAHPVATRLEEVCRRRGLHPFPTPRGINSRSYQGRPACIFCPQCGSWGCPVGARGTAQEALVAQAEATGRCEVRPRAMVCEITLGRDGRATGCVYLDASGHEHEVRARLVCVCCSAVESARLLLMSRSPRFPDGLANGSGRVGRHLQFHGVTMGHARLPAARLTGELRSTHPFLGRSVMDHYDLPPGVCDLPKGGLLRFGIAPPTPVAVPLVLQRPGEPVPPPPEPPPLRTRGEDEDLVVYFEVFHDFLPNPGTFVELDDEVRDRWGLPVARIHLDLPAHHRQAGQWMMERAFELFDDLGAVDPTPLDVGGTSAYLVHGTCRAGADAGTSVLDPYCQTHEVPNLFVVDGSFMPTSGGAAPTLTILANSFRTAEHILARISSRDFAQ